MVPCGARTTHLILPILRRHSTLCVPPPFLLPLTPSPLVPPAQPLEGFDCQLTRRFTFLAWSSSSCRSRTKKTAELGQQWLKSSSVDAVPRNSRTTGQHRFPLTVDALVLILVRDRGVAVRSGQVRETGGRGRRVIDGGTTASASVRGRGQREGGITSLIDDGQEMNSVHGGRRTGISLRRVAERAGGTTVQAEILHEVLYDKGACLPSGASGARPHSLISSQEVSCFSLGTKVQGRRSVRQSLGRQKGFGEDAR